MIKETARNLLIELLLECPHSKDNPKSCPVHKIRKLSFIGKMKFIEGLSYNDCIDLYGSHVKCLTERSLI